MRISDWSSDVCSSDLDRPRLAVQTMRNVRAKRRQEYLTIRTAKGARRGLRRSYCAWSRYGDILRHQRHLSNSTFGARPESKSGTRFPALPRPLRRTGQISQVTPADTKCGAMLPTARFAIFRCQFLVQI